MFCPSCRCEFRPGFTHCASCDVDLVESLDGPAPRASRPAPRAPAPARAEGRMQFCGFQLFEEARQARTRLADEGIGSDLLIRQAQEGEGDDAGDEYWLLISPSDFKAAQGILGYDLHDAGSEDTIYCSSCGEAVDASDDACPHCGEKFEEA